MLCVCVTIPDDYHCMPTITMLAAQTLAHLLFAGEASLCIVKNEAIVMHRYSMAEGLHIGTQGSMFL